MIGYRYGKRSAFFGILLFALVVFLVGSCSGNKLWGTWENTEPTLGGGTQTNTVVLSINNFTHRVTERDRNGSITYFNEEKGKFSVSDNRIEYVFKNGTSEIVTFSLTDNTITSPRRVPLTRKGR